jgi:general secretion pathway protein C
VFATIDRRSFELAALASCAALGALSLWLLARLVWLLVPRGDVALDTAAARVAAGNSGSAPAQSIAKWHLFGNTPPLVSGRDGTTTTLSMILRGTLAERDPATGIAVIGDGAGGERAYRAGDSIAAGVKLARVYPDHVIVLRNGAEETLKLTRDENLMPGNVVRPPVPTAGRAGRTQAPENSAPSPSPAASASIASTPRATSDWQQTVDRLRRNPDELARRVQIVPVLEGGRLTGVRVSAGTDAALINRIGLRAGDVVTAVNGAPVDSIARGQQIVDTLRNAASARVTVLRNGKPVDVTISLK